MQRIACPNCHFPKVIAKTAGPKRGHGTALAMGATGPVTAGLTWGLLLLWWARGDFSVKPLYRCQTCGHEWRGAQGVQTV
jgi:hypothetical protein